MIGAFGAIYFIWGSTYLAVRFAVETMPPLTMVAARSLTAGAILYLWARLRYGARPTLQHWKSAALVGALLFVGGHGGLSWAQQRVPSGVAALFIGTIPVWMTLIQAVTGGASSIGPRTVAGILAGSAAVWLLAGPQELLGSEPADAVGSIVLMLAALSWSLGSRVSQLSARPNSVTLVTGMYLLAGGFLSFLAAAVGGELEAVRIDLISARSAVALGYLIVFGSLVAFAAYTWLLGRTTLGALSTYAFVNPVVALLIGYMLGGEPLNARVLAAAALVVLGVVLILTEWGGKHVAAQSARSKSRLAHAGGAQRIPAHSECFNRTQARC
jgi:drug/metabolite transporter (DMT)-like permease